MIIKNWSISLNLYQIKHNLKDDFSLPNEPESLCFRLLDTANGVRIGSVQRLKMQFLYLIFTQANSKYKEPI